jgi:hypothetical protein
MPKYDLHPVAFAQMPRQTFGKIYRPVLPPGATERHHQVFETSVLIAADA